MAISQRPHIKGDISTVKTLLTFGFTQAQLNECLRVWVTPHDGDLVYLMNGEVPTATEGHIIRSEITTEFHESMPSLQLVAQSGTVNTTIELETYG